MERILLGNNVHGNSGLWVSKKGVDVLAYDGFYNDGFNDNYAWKGFDTTDAIKTYGWVWGNGDAYTIFPEIFC